MRPRLLMFIFIRSHISTCRNFPLKNAALHDSDVIQTEIGGKSINGDECNHRETAAMNLLHLNTSYCPGHTHAVCVSDTIWINHERTKPNGYWPKSDAFLAFFFFQVFYSVCDLYPSETREVNRCSMGSQCEAKKFLLVKSEGKNPFRLQPQILQDWRNLASSCVPIIAL